MTEATIRSSRRWLPRLAFWAAVFIAIASAPFVPDTAARLCAALPAADCDRLLSAALADRVGRLDAGSPFVAPPLLFDKVDALLQSGALKRAVVAPFPSLLPGLKATLFKLLKSKELGRPKASPAADRIIAERGAAA